jgi:hypothetical protein
MKYLAFVITAIYLLCVLWTSSVVYDAEVIGKLKIPAHDIRTTLMTAPEQSCGCCPVLWNGGIAYAQDDISAAQVGDTAKVTTLDGGRYVLECAEIVPCIRIGCYLVGWRGVVSADGDIIVFSGGKVYRWIML